MKFASLFFVAGLLVFLLPAVASAALDGNGLLQKCAPIEKLDEDPASLAGREASGVVYCLGYIDSFTESFAFQVQAKIVPGMPYCLPDGDIASKEIVKTVVDYLKNSDDDLAKPAGYYIFLAMRQAYPCGGAEQQEK